MVAELSASELGNTVRLAEGGTAVVYSIPDFFLPEAPSRKWVYKKYKSSYRPVSLYGMNGIVRLLDGLEAKQRQAFDRAFNWPVRVVVDDGDGAAGVILPLLEDEFFFSLYLSSGTVRRVSAEMQFMMQDREYTTKVRIPYPDVDQRRALVRSLAHAMGLLDRAEVIYGDLSARNVLFRLNPRPSVHLVDCDAVRVRGAAAAGKRQPHSPDWEPPEALAAKRRKDTTGFFIQSAATDRYKLGVAILRMLTPGVASSNLDPTHAKPFLPPDLYVLLERSLGSDQSARPSAKEWYEGMTK
jgi:hypothetical protein